MQPDFARVAEVAEFGDPLGAVMDVDYVELEQGLHQGAKPEGFFVATGAWDLRDEVAHVPDAAGAVAEVVDLVGGGWVAEDGDVDVMAEAAVDLEGPAREGSAVVGTELLAPGEEDADFEGWSGAGHAWANRRCCASGLSTDGLSRAGSVSAILVNGTL